MRRINISQRRLDIDKLLDNIAVQQADAYMDGAVTNTLILIMNTETIKTIEDEYRNISLTNTNISKTDAKYLMGCRIACDDSLLFGDVIIAR